MKTLLTLTLLLLSLIAPKDSLAQQGGQNDPSKWGKFEVLGDVFDNQTIDEFVGENKAVQKTAVPRFVEKLFNYAVAAIVIIGLMSIVVGGYVYMTAGGSSDRVGVAKTIIGSALLGIVLALLAVTILNTISPQFTSF